jgi:hypothetical protein
MRLWIIRWKQLLKKEGEGECSHKFGIDKFEECVFNGVWGA